MSHSTPDPNDEHGSVYDGLLGTDTSQWAFGTDFEDPLAGVDTTVPADLDPAELASYCLALGDDALVLSHRLSEWCSNAPDLEEDIALANIALDLLGQSRLLLARAAAADPSLVPALPEGSPVPVEDALAFFREAVDFRNVRLVEVANGDFGQTIARLLLFATVRLAAFERLAGHRDPVLAAIAAKGVKELTYHRDYAGRWFLTLAQGTEESRRRLTDGLTALWPLYDEFRHGVRRRAGRRRRPRPGLRGVRRRATRGRADGRPRPHRGALTDARRDAGRGPRAPQGALVKTAVDARSIAAEVRDPEMPMLTLEDLGVLRDVRQHGRQVTVTITPTYSGCPAMATMRDDLVHRLSDAGYLAQVEVSLSPAWSSDWITERGRQALRDHGLSAPGPAPRSGGPIPLTLMPTARAVTCPQCGSARTELTSEYGATACKALYRCSDCLEPFEHVKEI